MRDLPCRRDRVRAGPDGDIPFAVMERGDAGRLVRRRCNREAGGVEPDVSGGVGALGALDSLAGRRRAAAHRGLGVRAGRPQNERRIDERGNRPSGGGQKIPPPPRGRNEGIGAVASGEGEVTDRNGPIRLTSTVPSCFPPGLLLSGSQWLLRPVATPEARTVFTACARGCRARQLSLLRAGVQQARFQASTCAWFKQG